MEQNQVEIYLQRNHFTWDTKQGFCHRLSLGEEEVMVAVDALVNQGLLMKKGEGERALYGPATHREPANSKVKRHQWDRYALTTREMEVAACILDGLLNQEIAEALNISSHTVKNHMTNIFRKLEVGDRARAILKLAKSL
jgi:two-component system, NarL family, response regulator DegU